MVIKERYTPITVAANTTVPFTSSEIGGFLCIAAGTLTITRADGTVVVNALPVSAGVYYPLPFYIGLNGGSVTTASSASGVLGI